MKLFELGGSGIAWGEAWVQLDTNILNPPAVYSSWLPPTTTTLKRARMASLRSAFAGVYAMRAILPRTSINTVPATPKMLSGHRAFHSTRLTAQPPPNHPAGSDAAPSNRGGPPRDDASQTPLQKMFNNSAQRAKTMRVSLEKPKFGVLQRGSEPLTEADFEEAFRNRPLRGYQMNWTPYTGRTVTVQNGNVNQALRKLNTILYENNVRKQSRDQAYFEKPTLARRRVKQQRHYRKFAQAVREKVQLVRSFFLFFWPSAAMAVSSVRW